jgi:hypothetical protein
MQYIGTMEDYPVLKGKGNLTCIPYGWILKTFYKKKLSSHKRSDTAWFHLYKLHGEDKVDFMSKRHKVEW